MPTPLASRRSNRQAGLGAFTCAVLSCVVAPPLVRSAPDSFESRDNGGCNGGRNISFSQEDTGSTSDPSTGSETSETSTGEPVCGDGLVDPGEGCDDGNAADDDACPSGPVGQCKAEAECGDGIVWTGEEECDGGEGCEVNCTLTPAECGNGKMEAGEGCDDGNDLDDDGCPSGAMGQCKAEASCGDGIVWMGMEACDDGNTDDADGCPSGAMGNCLADAACGDGFVWSDMEVCDDGNADDTDVCPSGAGACQAEATCGDGFVHTEVEECDDKNAADLDECSNTCASPRWVFVTSVLYNGNLGGVAGADAYCQMRAEAGVLPGQYMAWLTGADPSSAPATRFGSTEFKGWYLLPTDPPTPVALGWADLTSPNDDMPMNYLQNAIIVDETGKNVSGGTVWTNTNPDGTQQPGGSHCMDWESNMVGESGQVGIEDVGVVDVLWTSAEDDGCGGGNRLYCFQVG